MTPPLLKHHSAANPHDPHPPVYPSLLGIALIALKYTAERTISLLRKSQQEVRRMLVKIALENPTWRYLRIVGALQNLGVRQQTNRLERHPDFFISHKGVRPPLSDENF